MRQAILVLGMHRSGTSALTRVLSLLGAALPKHVMPPAAGNNEAGFWEPERLTFLHDQMLAESGSRWDDWRAFDPAALPPERMQHYKAEIACLIDEEYGDTPLLVLKDPRICRFVGLYADILTSKKIDLRHIISTRNPLAVMASLTKRDGFTPGYGALLWLRHALEAERATRGAPRAFLSYESLMHDWRGGIDRLAYTLAIEWPRPVDEAAADINAFLLPELQHHVADDAQLLADKRVTQWVKDAYAALTALEQGADNDTALATLDRVKTEFDAVAPIFGNPFYGELATRERATTDALKLSEERADEIALLDTELTQERNDSIVRNAYIASLEQNLDDIRRSRAWKLALRLRHAKIFMLNLSYVQEIAKLHEAIRAAGGAQAAIRKTRHVLHHEGWPGLLYRIKRIKSHPPLQTGHKTISVTEFPCYSSEYQAQDDFSDLKTDIKAIAFHLPQFHRIPQNDQWWEDGFTEWTNTKKAQPRFPGHYQPRKPHQDIGYYDLSDTNTLRKQAALARAHGIFGFCFYHYWFSGQRILEKPVENLIVNKDIDIRFCLCWANENWTRTWDGLAHDILLQQKYQNDDPARFIDDVTIYFEDHRYIRIDGRPVILVYKANSIPNVDYVFRTWRTRWKEKSGGELEIWCVQTDLYGIKEVCEKAKIDGIVEFPPHVTPHAIDPKSVGAPASGHLFNYRQLVSEIQQDRQIRPVPETNLYRTVMLGWDNSARRENGWSVWYGFGLRPYYDWLRHIVAYTRKGLPHDRRFIFINAWNEWAEGTYLEPDADYGYANINTTSKALFDVPFDGPIHCLPISKLAGTAPNCKTAIHVHVYYGDLIEEIANYLSYIPVNFDLYITTNSSETAALARERFSVVRNTEHLDVVITPNRGRDIGPLMCEVGSKLLKYDIFGHFHTKKSTTVSWGHRWRRYLLDNLLGNEALIQEILTRLQSSKTGLIFPPPYTLVATHSTWGGVKKRCMDLLQLVGCEVNLPTNPTFPAGNMFWAKTKALVPILEHKWEYTEFEEEAGQVELTLAHTLERAWGYIAASQGYRTEKILSKSRQISSAAPRRRRLAVFAHYDASNRISDADIFLVRSIKEACDQVVFVSNSKLKSTHTKMVANICDECIIRENKGFDFSMWRSALLKIGAAKVGDYDELWLVNNSVYGPLFPLEELIMGMSGIDADFWGVTGFPSIKHSNRPEARTLAKRNIDAHIQSYFLCFNSSILKSQAFWEFWDGVIEYDDMLRVVAEYETKLTRYLLEAGFRWDCYIPESIIAQEARKYDPHYTATYNDPMGALILRCPFLKKKIIDYAPDQRSSLRSLIERFGYYPIELLDRRFWIDSEH